MLTRTQLTLIGAGLGGPLLLMLFLILINPNYEGELFKKSVLGYGINYLIIIEILHLSVLYFGFRAINRASLKTDGQASRQNLPMILLVLLTIVLFALPAFWCVVLYPSVMILMQSNVPL